MLIVEKLPWANTLDVTRGRRGGDRGAAARTARHRDRHHDLPAGDLHRGLDRQPHEALLIGALLVVLVLGAFLFEWRAALISVVSIPLSLVAAGLVLYLRDTTVNMMVLAGLRDRDRASSSTTRSSTSRTSSAGCASTARRAASLDGVRSSSRPRSRCGAPIVYATLIIVAAMMPVFFLDGPDGRLLQAARLLLHPGGGRLAARRADRHAGAGPDPSAERPARAARLAARRSGSSAATSAALARIISQAALGLRDRSGDRRGGPRCGAVPRPVAAAGLQGAGLPDALADHARHLRPGGGPRSRCGLPASCGRSRASATAAPTSARPYSSDEPYGIYFGENWISVDPKVDYDETLASVQERRRRLSRPPPRRPDLPEGADPRGADRVERRRSSCASTATT